ncbi:hypothetical protein Leryth_022971 [Lithospermum erythrorhizon]|nr:hypothetical protein Leryth_022971 [Lithospermum erythrorhizon]
MEEHRPSQNEIKRKVSIDGIQEEHLVLLIKDKMENISLSHCISKVPEEHFKGNHQNYNPTLVSIGPFHHAKHSLREMEAHKWHYLNTLFSRKQNSEETLSNCLKTLRRLEEKARKCYGGNMDMESDKFVQVMLLDACFIIELFFAYSIKGLRRRDDPCFSSNERFFHIRCDLILLENQIPFFILQQLFQLVPIPRECSYSLQELTFRFFRKLIPGGAETPQVRSSANVLHILDLIRQSYLPTSQELHSKIGQTELKNAQHLQKSGINFKRANRESLMNLEFKNGVLKMPALTIHNYTETLFRNFITFEHCCGQQTKHITSYALLMICLLKSKNDIKLLQQKGIMDVGTHKHEEILNLFRNFPIDLSTRDFYYKGLFEKINCHKSIKSKVVLVCGK